MRIGVLGGIITLMLAIASGNVNGADLKAKEPPIHIQSNTLEAFAEKKLVVFSGNAVAVRGDMVLKGDKILVYYRGNEAGKGGEGEVDRIEAQGNVVLTQKERTAQGDYAVYEHSTQRVTMTGNAVLREGKNVVRGEKIIWIIPEKRGMVEGEGKKRVTAIIYPSEREGKGIEEVGGKKIK